MVDKPVGTVSGRPVYDNTATVVCLLVPKDRFRDKLLVIRRKNHPGAHKLALPGGFQMYGESWQDAGVREVREETSYIIDKGSVKQFGQTVTDEYKNNLIVAHSSYPEGIDRTVDITSEVLEAFWADSSILVHSHYWAFPLHYRAAKEFFLGRESFRMDYDPTPFKSNLTYGY